LRSYVSTKNETPVNVDLGAPVLYAWQLCWQ